MKYKDFSEKVGRVEHLRTELGTALDKFVSVSHWREQLPTTMFPGVEASTPADKPFLDALYSMWRASAELRKAERELDVLLLTSPPTLED
jgi:hypothetical protein